MTTYHTGFLYLSDSDGEPVEIVNEARTAENLLTQDCSIVSNVLEYAGCLGLTQYPSQFGLGENIDWQALPDANPWASATPASAEALGFTIEEWTGLDGAHHTREIIGLGNKPGGARFGRQSQRHRVMALNLLLHGSTERGLNYLFRWLETQFIRACQPCAKTSLWTHESCPETTNPDDLEDTLLRLDDVVLLSGPEWTTPPWEGDGCFLRRVTLTLASGKPCLYRPSVEVSSSNASQLVSMPTAGVNTWADCDEWEGLSPQAISFVPAVDVGLASPIVTIENTGSGNLPSMRLYGIADAAGFDPCASQYLGLIIVCRLPAGYEIMIDCADASALVRSSSSAPWVDGSQYLCITNDFVTPEIDVQYVGTRAFTFCEDGWVVVEPARILTSWAGTALTWTVAFYNVTRLGCS